VKATLRVGAGFLLLSTALGCRSESTDSAVSSAQRDAVSSSPGALSLGSPGPSERPGPTPLQELERITEEDYEEEAIVDISKDTLDEELDRLEREIGE
jgi:hypothetical protein